MHYLHGTVIDFGCGDEKIIPQAIGVDMCPEADIQLDLTNPGSFHFFNDNAADVIFSSHFLEHVHDYRMVLKEWWRILKPGGKLILYLPHRELYPNIGQYGANPDHKHDFVPSDILFALKEFTDFEVLRNKTYPDDNEYSFELIIKKTAVPRENVIERDNRDSVLVIRYGAVGDIIVITPLLRLLKEQGERVVVLTIPGSTAPLINNPNVDDIMLVQRGSLNNSKLHEYHAELEKQFKRVINLCESVERSLLLEARDEDKFFLSKEERHKLTNVNYYDNNLRMAGFDVTGLRPEIYPTENEDFLGGVFRKKNRGCFVIQWQLTGSSVHKLYPWAEYVIEELQDRHDDIKVYLSGGPEVSMVQDWYSPMVINKLGVWTMRQSLVMPKYVDLVVSPETGVLNAAGAFDTPKIGLLTHSSIENITKYFLNDYSIESIAPCAPCHRLVHDTKHCEVDKEYGFPVCMSEGHPPHRVLEQIEKVYERWKDAANKARRGGLTQAEAGVWRA